MGVEGKVGEPAEAAREREGQGMEGHGKRAGEDESLCSVRSLEGRVAAITEQKVV